MELDEARMKSYQVTREGQSVRAGSGLATAAAPTTFEVALDLQSDGAPKITGEADMLRFVGTYTGFTYSPDLALGDRLYDTPFGALRVESIYPWDDEEPLHFQVGLVPA